MDERQKFLENAAKEREERMRNNAIKNVVDKIQALSRGYLLSKKFKLQFM